jgi:hypothetical protein
MTAAGEGRLSPRAALDRLALVALFGTAFLTIAGCTPDASPTANAPTPEGSTAVPADDEQAISRTIEKFNDAAAGPAADQQAVLTELVDPALVVDLDRCPPVTATLRFEPIYPALRPAPEWAPTSGVLGGTVYALPTLIRIYTGDRITGTDLTTLHLGVVGGEAYLTSLCLG